jgi:dihydroorotase
MTYFLPQVTIVDPQSPFHLQKVDIRLHDGQIEAIGPDAKRAEGDKLLELKNAHIAPSWVDIGAQSGEPGFEHRETLDSLSSAAHAGGYGHVVIRPDTQPALDNASAIRSIAQYHSPYAVQLYPMAGASVQGKGTELTEWLDLAAAGAVAFSNAPEAISSNAFMLKALQYGKRVGRPLIHNPHDRTFVPGAQVHESQQSISLGLKSWPEAAETLLMDRDLVLLEYSSGHIVWDGLSSAGAVDRLRRASKKGVRFSAGLGYLHLCFSEEEVQDFNTLFKMSPPLRSDKDREALWAAIREGLISYVSSQHSPVEQDLKDIEFPYAAFGAEGLETVMSGFLKYCPLDDPLTHWVQLAAIGPRKLLGWEPVALQKGQVADFTLFDPDTEYVLEKHHLQSLSFNNPNLGRPLKGQIFGRLINDAWWPTI